MNLKPISDTELLGGLREVSDLLLAQANGQALHVVGELAARLHLTLKARGTDSNEAFGLDADERAL